MGEHVVPRHGGPLTGRLGDVADDRHRPRQAAPAEHAQLHGRELLGLVHHDVAVGPGPVVVGRRLPLGRPEQRPGLVEQGQVGVGPGHRVGSRPGVPAQKAALVVGEEAPAGQVDQRGRPEEVPQQLLGREDRPHPLERLDHLRPPAHLPAEVSGVDGRLGRRATPPGQAGEVLVVQMAPEQHLDLAAAGVVGPGASLHGVDDVGRRLLGQGQDGLAEGDADRPAQWPFPVADGASDETGHAGVAFEAGRRPAVLAGRQRIAEEPPDRRQLHAGLAEGGKHVLDVAQEQGVRPDDEHALLLEREAVGVEEVGRPVQGDGRLAGARPALDDQDPGQRAPDDLVLFPLDGGDDVPHAAAAGPLEGGQEHGRSRQAGAEPPVGIPAGPAEQLVFEIDDAAAFGQEVAAAGQVHGVGARGPVEGLSDGCPPVHDERLLVGVGDGQAADVKRFRGLFAVGVGGQPVDAAEDERLTADLQLLEAVEAGSDHDVPLGHGLKRPPPLAKRRVQHVQGGRTHSLQPVVGVIDVSLLSREIGMRHKRDRRLLAFPRRDASPRIGRSPKRPLRCSSIDPTVCHTATEVT